MTLRGVTAAALCAAATLASSGLAAPGIDGSDTSAARSAAVRSAVVRSAAVSSTVSVSVPGPRSAPEYWFARWNVPQLRASGARGQGVTIGLIDTGVTASLPELTGRVLPGKDFGPGGNGQLDRDVSTFGHGTAMASIMVARPGLLDIAGLAPGAKILPVAVPLDGTTDAGRPDRLAAAITWAADHGAEIINLSLGGKQYPGRDSVPCPSDEQQAVFHALELGAVVVAAVGNTGPTVNTVEDPASCLGVVSVGAVDRSGALASFSSHEPFLTLVAPGVDIPSLGREAGDAFSGDGTSQAAALVSAALALAKSAHRDLDGRALVTRLLATLDDGTASPSSSLGYGELDAGALVRADVPADAANPVYAKADPFYRRYLALHTLDSADLAAPAPAGSAPPTRSIAVDADPVARADENVLYGLALVALGVLVLVALETGPVRRWTRPTAVPRD